MIDAEMKPGLKPIAERREAFGDALRDAIAAAGVTQRELGTQLGIEQNTVSTWLTSRAEPRYEQVFAIERALEVRPGSLSRILGYLPLDAVRTVADVESAIKDDPGLSAEARAALLSTYRTIRGTTTRSRRKQA